MQKIFNIYQYATAYGSCLCDDYGAMKKCLKNGWSIIRVDVLQGDDRYRCSGNHLLYVLQSPKDKNDDTDNYKLS